MTLSSVGKRSGILQFWRIGWFLISPSYFDTDFMTFDFFFHAFDILYIKKLNSEELFQGVGGNEHILLGGGHHPDDLPARLSSLL